jgi:hypothetical protein
VCRLWAASSTLRIGNVTDLVKLLHCPRWPGYQPKGEPAPDDRRRHIAHGSRLANRADLLRSAHHTNGSGPSPFALAGPHPPLITHPGPALQLVVVQRLAITAASHDQHSRRNKLIACVGARPGIPRTSLDSSGFGENVNRPPAISRSSAMEASRFWCSYLRYRMQVRLCLRAASGCEP